jgi:hypothetical protein
LREAFIVTLIRGALLVLLFGCLLPWGVAAQSAQNVPGMTFDCIAIYATGDLDLANYWASLYDGGEISGSLVCDIEVTGGPLDPDASGVRLLRDDGYVVLATAPFSVTAAP